MAKIQVIRQGESLPFEFCLGTSEDDETSNWICTIYVKQYPADDSVITRVIELDTDNDVWEGYLTASETADLDGGLWLLIGVLTNSITDEEQQIPVRFSVTVPWI